MLGPGLITGASDDDPSGIATYSQAGAQFGFDLGWTLLFSWPLMCAIQEICARIGRVTGRGIGGNLKKHYPGWVVYGIVLLLVSANVINLGADLGAMGAAREPAARQRADTGSADMVPVVGFAVVSVVLEVFVRYSRYVSVLKWLTLSLFAYVGVVFVVHMPWAQVAYHLVAPKLSTAPGYLTVVVAILGTTISPYLFFWQAEEEVEEVKERADAKPLVRAPEQATAEFRRIRVDTYIGMAFSNAVALFIVLTTAATLHAHGVTDIQTSSQAAVALKPIAGQFTFAIFALGIIGTGLLALPVLAGSAAYAVGEAFGWHVGLARKWYRAPTLLRRHGRRLRHRRAPQLRPHRPDQGPVLERGDQWRRRGAAHGPDHAHGRSQGDHGRLQAARRPEDDGLDRHGGHDGRGCRDVRDHGGGMTAAARKRTVRG